MVRSKRFERLAEREVNKDTFVQEAPELGLILMDGPNDPAADRPPLTGPCGMLVHGRLGRQRGWRSWSGLRGRPRGHCGNEDLRGWRLITQRAVRADGVVMATPTFNHDLGLGQRVEDFAVQKFVAKPRVE